MTSILQPTFAAGELSPSASARTDIARYYTGLKLCRNFMVMPYGGVRNRPGTRMICEVADSTKLNRLIPFQFNDEQTYILQFGDQLMRVIKDGGQVLFSSGPFEGFPYQINMPYTQYDLKQLNYTQSADLMTFAHPSYKPRDLGRLAHDNWLSAEINLAPRILPPASATATPTAGTGTNTQVWRYQITAVLDDGNSIDESIPVTSNAVTVFPDTASATIVWPAVPGATYYIVYKDNAGAGIYGFIGRATALTFIRLTGLNFTNDSTGNTFRVHNFSRDGRSGRYVSQDVIDKTTAGCYAFIWALGTNDVTGYDAAAQIAFDQRIDWIIAAAATNRTRVVFIDFLFGQPYSHGLRASLRRGAAAIPNSIFIDVEQLWTVSGVQYTEAERVSRNLSSGVHPEEVGHRLVAETLAQRLGLVCTSKKQAILDDPIWKSLDISASGLKNRLNVAGQMCAYRIRDNQIEVVMDTATVPAAVTTIGTIPPADFPPINGFNFASNPDATGKFGLFTVSGSGAVIYRPNPESSAAPNACQLNVALPYRQSYSWP
ncbi:hypothetical protein GIW70_19960 [Pseudomonas syringae]|nr:hypothetical protein [Pseudomonas syringae]MCF5070463.1 hypothetical protein [Pseudomonas syringae]